MGFFYNQYEYCWNEILGTYELARRFPSDYPSIVTWNLFSGVVRKCCKDCYHYPSHIEMPLDEQVWKHLRERCEAFRELERSMDEEMYVIPSQLPFEADFNRNLYCNIRGKQGKPVSDPNQLDWVCMNV